MPTTRMFSSCPVWEPAGLHDIYGSALAAQPGKS